MIFAQITEGKVSSVFPCEQDSRDWPGLVQIQEDDPLYVEFLDTIAAIEMSSTFGSLASQADAQVSAINGRIDTLNFAIAGNDASKAEKEELPIRVDQLNAWRQYSLTLSRVPTQSSWPHSPQWPDQPEMYYAVPL